MPPAEQEDGTKTTTSTLPLVFGTTERSSSISSRKSSNTVEIINDDDRMLEEDKVTEKMREQDAELLESMHYAASCVSHYSPGGTPVLRPKDRSLPMEDVIPLMLMPSCTATTNQQNSDHHHHHHTESSCSALSQHQLQDDLTPSRTASFHRPISENSSKEVEDLPRSTSFRSVSKRVGSDEVSWLDASERERDPFASTGGDNTACSTDSRFRRLLSGEVVVESGEVAAPESGETEEEETTASPVSVAQEAASAISQKQKKEEDNESGLAAKQRRFSEAMQFAEAVGEEISINREDLCIIEDHTDEDDSCDSEDEKTITTEVIRVSDLEAADAISQSNSVHTNRYIMQASSGNNSLMLEQQQLESTSTNPPALPRHVDIEAVPEQLTRHQSKKRPAWPFGPTSYEYRFLDDRLSSSVPEHYHNEQPSFVYKGICANPPEITKRGIQRGNYAQLHRKAWLEVSDKYHRYGKNLRLYYRYWESMGFPTNQFFDWLDSKGEAAGQPLPNLEECPRSVLDSDTVLYINNLEVTENYACDILVTSEDGRGRMVDVDGHPVLTGPDGWIFVLRDNVMYGSQKVTSITGHSKKRFHHSSFFGGKAVACAGIVITDYEGYLVRLYPHSGHYRPGEAHMQRMLFFLHRKGVNLRSFYVDTQQFRHVARDTKEAKNSKDKDKDGKNCNKENNNNNLGDNNGDGEKKAKKVDTIHLEKAVNVACFLSHKVGFIGSGIFDKIHQIRKADVTSVSEALELVDDGGFWPKVEEDSPISGGNDLSAEP